ncbi:hypothetical protein niasHS_004612 [Heterodera schachtii]|uniref:Uncharacterized protein n=1 Tax=Heterodera schachtii TaxID=97005 RepID=A0ABD2JR23_HETSC
MVITRSPHLTRQRTRQQGIILDNEGNQIPAPDNEQQNFENIISITEENATRNWNEPIDSVNDLSEGGSILSDAQLRHQLLELDSHEFGELNASEIRNLPPIGHLFERNEDFEDSWVRERPPLNAPLFESMRHAYFNVDRFE